MSTVKDDTISSVKWTSVESFFNTGVGFVLGVVLARLLSPADYGVVGMTGIFVGIAVIFIDGGFGMALIQKKNPTDEDRSTVFFFNITAAAICYLILFFAAPWIADILSTPALKDIIRVICLSFVIGSFAGVQYNLLTKNIDFKSQALISMTGNICQGIIGVVMAYNGFGPWAIVIPSLFSTTYSTVGAWIRSPWRPKFVFSKKSLKELFSFGGNMTVDQLINTIYGNISSLVIGKFYTPTQLGYYNKGASSASTPSRFVQTILNKVLFPIMSKIQDDEQYLIHVFSKYMQITSMVLFFAGFLLLALAKPFTVFLYSSKWLPSVTFMSIICISVLFGHMPYVNNSLMLARRRSDLYLRKQIVEKVIGFAGLVIGLSISVEALCWSGVVCTIINLMINAYTTSKCIDYGLRKQMADFLPYLVKGAVFCIPAFLVTLLPINYGFMLLLGGSVSTLLYVAFLWKSNDENFHYLVSVIPWHKFVPKKVLAKFGK